jgi:hypothetical protein
MDSLGGGFVLKDGDAGVNIRLIGIGRGWSAQGDVLGLAGEKCSKNCSVN